MLITVTIHRWKTETVTRGWFEMTELVGSTR